MIDRVTRPISTRFHSEQRSANALGIAMLAVALLVVGAIVLLVVEGVSLIGDGSFPAPATAIVLFAGFVMFSMARRRA